MGEELFHCHSNAEERSHAVEKDDEIKDNNVKKNLLISAGKSKRWIKYLVVYISWRIVNDI